MPKIAKLEPRQQRDPLLTLQRQIDALTKILDEHDKYIVELQNRLMDANLALRYTMEAMKMQRRSPILGGDGQAPVVQVETLYEIFQRDRLPFIARLAAREEARVQAAHQNAGGAATGPSLSDIERAAAGVVGVIGAAGPDGEKPITLVRPAGA